MFDAFYSDPHFGHKNIIEYCNRPFKDVDHMTEEFIRRYNEVVGPDDDVLWLGDCFFCKPNKAAEILSRLNGGKCVVLGNHDRPPNIMEDMGFEVLAPFPENYTFSMGGKSFRASHLPPWADANQFDMRFRNLFPKRFEGETLLYGHTHSKKRLTNEGIHCGVDAWDYAPVTAAQILELVAQSSPP